MANSNDYPVDIVITWVDGNDPKWIAEKNKYVSQKDQNNKAVAGKERYDDNGLLKYLFRGIDKFLPWVNKVHFVTWGHLPEWLDVQNPKINIVKHEDFIPSQYLPVFCDTPISLNFHRIKDLAEHFIYVCSDMYFLKPTPKTLFFRNGKPCDMAVMDLLDYYFYGDVYYHIQSNNLSLLNRITNKKDSIKKHLFKWFNFRYGLKYNFKNLLLSHFNLYSGFYEPHTPTPYLKSTYDYIWKTFPNELDNSSSFKVRSSMQVTEVLMRQYQINSGEFYPINRDKYGRYCMMNQKEPIEWIKNQKYNMICINYSNETNYHNYEQAFDNLLPEKSSFEK